MKRFYKWVAGILILGLVVVTACAPAAQPPPTEKPPAEKPPAEKPPPTEKPPPAEPIKLIASHGYPAGEYIINLAQLKFEELTEKYTDGRVEVDVFPTGQLYGAREEINACIMGSVQFVSTPNVFASAYQPWYTIMEVPLLFESFDQWNRFLNDPQFMKIHRDTWAAKGLKAFPYQTLEMLYSVWTKKPMDKMTSWDGLKMRCGSKMADFIKCWGASGILIESAEIMTALQTGMVDGLIVTPDWVNRNKAYNIISYGWPEGKYIIYSGGMDYLINLKFWDSLPPDIQDIIETKVMPEVNAYTYKKSGEAVPLAFKAFNEAGMKFAYPSEAEIKKMKEAIVPLTLELAKKDGFEELLKIVQEMK